jgi:hypothetical protein
MQKTNMSLSDILRVVVMHFLEDIFSSVEYAGRRGASGGNMMRCKWCSRYICYMRSSEFDDYGKDESILLMLSCAMDVSFKHW